MAYTVCHAPLELKVRCFLKVIQWKSITFSNNIIHCLIVKHILCNSTFYIGEGTDGNGARRRDILIRSFYPLEKHHNGRQKMSLRII